MFTEQYIRFEASSAQVFHRGKNYFQAGCVFEIEYNPLTNSFDAMVEGTYDYQVSVDLTKDKTVSDYRCNCEAFHNDEGACKHVVAVLLEILSRKKEWSVEQTMLGLNEATKHFFEFAEKDPSGNAWVKESIDLIPTLCVGESHGVKKAWLELSIGNERMYLVKNIKALVQTYLREESLVLGKQLTYDAKKHTFQPVGKAIMDLLVNQYYDESEMIHVQLSASGSKLSHSSFAFGKQFKLNNSQVHQVLNVMDNRFMDLYVNEVLYAGVYVTKGKPDVVLDIQSSKEKGMTSIGLRQGQKAYAILDWQGKYIFYKDTIYAVDDAFAAYFQKLLPCFDRSKTGTIDIPDVFLDRFTNEVYPTLNRCASTVHSDTLEARYERMPLMTEVFFDRFESGITAKVHFKYGDLVINPCRSDGLNGMSRVLRDRLKEKKIIGLLKGYGFTESTEHYVLHDEESLFSFLELGVLVLKEEAQLFYSDDFRQFKVREGFNLKTLTRVNTHSNLLEVSFEYDLEDAKELMAVLEAYRMKRKYIRLKDGSVLKLYGENLEALSEIAAYNEKILSGAQKTLNGYEAFYVQRLLERYGTVEQEVCENYRQRFQGVKKAVFSDESLSKTHVSILRDYQKKGVLWFKTLSHYGFGGILADDMGLGKTLQVLSYLLSEKEQGRLNHPALVVAPTSLIYNWQDEVGKFAKDLTVMVVAGGKKERMACFEGMHGYDLVITTYGMLKRDLDHYKAQRFSYCFIDEAQHIKNPLTLNAKSVKSIQAGGFFALTGTPIENALTELWSIFDFIMPGYLGSVKQFQRQYMPQTDNAEITTHALGLLKHQIDPFILRRLKKEVLTELPDKIESKTTCEMTKDQRLLYKAQLLKAKEELTLELKEKGLQKSRIKILSILTRLRQICCHPSLFLEDYTGGSGKLDQLLELVDDALSSGHRLLIFSQFTSMLAVIRKALESREIQCFYLDGGTPPERRTEMCKQFNDGENEVFLISLKAGGTGLNLTGADMVVHVDPWWNPAVEDQATDRAYRMGQKKSVQVFKMITKDTIEEKIFALQEKKKHLIDSVIDSGEDMITKMSESDILSLFED